MEPQKLSQKNLFKSDTSYNLSSTGFKRVTSQDDRTDITLSAAVILAGGKSRRLGGVSKATLKIGSTTVVDRLLDILEPFDNIYLSVANSDSEIKTNLVQIPDKEFDKGPLCAITTVFEKTVQEHILFVPCDMPFITREILFSLITSLKTEDCDAVVLCDTDGKVHPLCCAISRKVLPVLQQALSQNNLRLLCFFKKVETCALEVDDKYLININTTQDLKIARNFLK